MSNAWEARSAIRAAIGLAVMTLTALGIAYVAGVRGAPLIVILLVLAAGEILLEVLYFMRVQVGNRLFRLAFSAGFAVAVVIAGSLAALLKYA